jgi:hypothetical protein
VPGSIEEKIMGDNAGTKLIVFAHKVVKRKYPENTPGILNLNARFHYLMPLVCSRSGIQIEK